MLLLAAGVAAAWIENYHASLRYGGKDSRYSRPGTGVYGGEAFSSNLGKAAWKYCLCRPDLAEHSGAMLGLRAQAKCGVHCLRHQLCQRHLQGVQTLALSAGRRADLILN